MVLLTFLARGTQKSFLMKSHFWNWQCLHLLFMRSDILSFWCQTSQKWLNFFLLFIYDVCFHNFFCFLELNYSFFLMHVERGFLWNCNCFISWFWHFTVLYGTIKYRLFKKTWGFGKKYEWEHRFIFIQRCPQRHSIQ